MFYTHFLLCAYTINEAILLKGGLSFNTLCRLVKVSSKKTGGAILSKLLHTFDITRNTTLLKVINVKEGRGFFIQTILPSGLYLKAQAPGADPCGELPPCGVAQSWPYYIHSCSRPALGNYKIPFHSYSHLSK